MERERLDKLLARQGRWSRKEVKELLRRGAVTVEGEPVRRPETKLEPGTLVEVEGRAVALKRYVYMMMNKPPGVLCATRDPRQKTVLDLVPEELRRKNLFPAGRLDKDTEGFVLLTDDGDFAHRMLSPRSHVEKTYYAELDGPLKEGLQQEFAQGTELEEADGKPPVKTMPARLTPLPPAPGRPYRAELTICEGAYHQVKRMFEKYGLRVCYLKRIKMGNLPLDNALLPGESRELTEEELKLIC